MLIPTALSYDDVLLIPQYSDVLSRSDVSLEQRMGAFRTSIPIIASPMNTISESDMMVAMNKAGGLAILHRFNTIKEQRLEVLKAKNAGVQVLSAAIGMTGDFLERAQALYSVGVRVITIDVAHGHHSLMKDALRELRKAIPDPDLFIIAGNVATPDGFYDLSYWGANAVRVGIGPGCFLPENKVRTVGGLKNIEDIVVGEKVKTHKNRFRKVVKVFSFKRQEKILKINNKIRCTKNHRFYVLEKKYGNIVTDENIHQYAIWVEAQNLNKDTHFLLETD